MPVYTGKRENIILYLLTMTLAVAFLLIGNRVASKRIPQIEEDPVQPIAADVLTIIDRKEECYDFGGNEEGRSVYITFSARLRSGKNRGEIVEALQTVDYLMAGALDEVSKGDRVLLYQEEEAFRGHYWMMGEYRRTDLLFVLLAVFAGALLLLGQAKGFHTLISLVFTVLAVIQVFIPAVLCGYNVYLWAVVTCLFVVTVTLLLVSGFSTKTLGALLGCAGGLGLCGVLTAFSSSLLRITGIIDQETAYLAQMNPQYPLDMQGLVFAGILIGAMGAVMDVGLSLASALWELRCKGREISFRSFFASGLVIGRDMLGTMSNTLILAYIGGSMATVLMLAAYRSPMLGIFNRELVAVELLRMLVGSLGILLTAPVTSLVCAFLYIKDQTFVESRKMSD